MKSAYLIAGIFVRVDAPTELKDTPGGGFCGYRVSPDEIPAGAKMYDIRIIPEENFAVPDFHGETVFQDPMHMVVQSGDKCLHLFHIPATRGVSAWNWIETGNTLEIHCHADALGYYLNSVGCFNCACIERLFYSAGKYLFHCSYVDDAGSAVLFSAPSGGGKTTQALLWEQYGGAEIINGDRAILEAVPGGCIAHGLPIAGSSDVFVNRSLPIRAVFVVEKAQVDSTTRLSNQEAFQALFSELTINTWNAAFVLDAVDFAMQMAEIIPVFRLECMIDEGAVQAAKKAVSAI